MTTGLVTEFYRDVENTERRGGGAKRLTDSNSSVNWDTFLEFHEKLARQFQPEFTSSV
jgi:hypothetical protein